MARNKVKLQYITNNSVRRNTLKKRRQGILKKVEEISVLCGVDACGVIYSPEEANPQVWPQKEDARRIITTFNELPEHERTRRMNNHITYMQDRVEKQKKKLAKRESENFNSEVRAILFEGFQGSDFAGVGEEFLGPAEAALDGMISKVFERLTLMKDAGMERDAGAGPVAAPTAPSAGEAGPSTWAMQGQAGDLESSDEIIEIGDSEDEDDDE